MSSRDVRPGAEPLAELLDELRSSRRNRSRRWPVPSLGISARLRFAESRRPHAACAAERSHIATPNLSFSEKPTRRRRPLPDCQAQLACPKTRCQYCQASNRPCDPAQIHTLSDHLNSDCERKSSSPPEAKSIGCLVREPSGRWLRWEALRGSLVGATAWRGGSLNE